MNVQSYLAVATGVLVCAAIEPRLFQGSPPWRRAAARLTIFAILTFILVQAIGSPLQPRFHGDGLITWERIIEASWWIIAARGAIGLSRLLVVLEHRPRESQIISDLIAGAIYVAALLAIVNFVFEVPIGGLLATSGIIAIVLGLALQSTLSDVFSGIAVGIERPYRAGDQLWVEGGIEGKVVQVNWRSTHVATMNGDVAVIPNSVIAKARLINHSLPSPRRSSSLEVRLDPTVPPDKCMATLKAAVQTCLIPIAQPEPKISRTGLYGDGALYEVSFTVASGDRLAAARDELFGELQRHLRHAGIPLAVQGLASVPRVGVPTVVDLLELSDMFGIIEATERNLLADHLVEVRLVVGESLIRRGETPNALYIVASGAVEITAETEAGSKIIHRMGPGGTLGAIGLITGAPYAATATALTPLTAYRLDAGAIATAIAARPQLSVALEELARRGQAAIKNDIAAHESERSLEPTDLFLDRVRNFLHILAVGESSKSELLR